MNTPESLLDRIARYLMINASFTNDLGLFHGKMGIVLFFSHYGRYKNDPVYQEFAGELLDEIYEDLHDELPIYLENGLCGLGWGIEYLVQHHFMNGETGVVLEDIDRRILERDPGRINDISLRKGLTGLALYMAEHLSSPHLGRTIVDREYVEDISRAIHYNSCLKDYISPRIFSFYNQVPYIPLKEQQLSFENLLSVNRSDINPDMDLSGLPLGIENGIAGIGFNIMKQ